MTATSAQTMFRRLRFAGIRTREAAIRLTIDERDQILGVAAWSGAEDACWEAALDLLDRT